MKTLNKITLLKAGIAPSDILNKKAQKHILGGERERNTCCYWEKKDPGTTYPCGNPIECYGMSGWNNDLWCCQDPDLFPCFC